MSPRNGDWATTDDDPELLDDETAEQLLSGRYSGDAPDLVALAQALDAIHAVADEPPPRPSPALERLLGGSEVPVPAPAAADPWAATARIPQPRAAVDPPPTSRTRRRWGLRWLPAGAVAVGASAVALTTAAAAGVLPAPAQRVMASVVRTVTPFEVPEPSGDAAIAKPPPSIPNTAATGPGAAGAAGAAAGGGGASAPPTPGATAPARGGGPAASASNGAPSGSSGSSAANGPSASTPGATAPGRPAGSTPASTPPGQVKPDLTATLSGSAVAPKGGDADGSGVAALTLDPAHSELCLQLTVSGISAPASVSVHAGAQGRTGPAVATIVPPVAATGPSCVAVDRDVITQVRAHPSDYYVEVDNADFPGGALRGQLEKA